MTVSNEIPEIPRNDGSLMPFVQNMLMMRQRLLQRLIDPRRDLDVECGYPPEITATLYLAMYERNEIAARVVEVWPKESWAVLPDIYENEDEAETDWDTQVKSLFKQHNIYNVLERLDILSGIGSFGALLIGVKDGLDPSFPINGIGEDGNSTGTATETELLYLRPFHENLVRIAEYQLDPTSPRFGLPLYYMLTVQAGGAPDGETITQATSQTKDLKVHWSRVLHVADNRGASDVFGTPRQQRVFNRICDLRKLLGGSPEMFWRGAFPGYSFEVNPSLLESGLEFDAAALKSDIEQYTQGLQRYVSAVGVSAKSLAPQVADPTQHFEVQIAAVCIAIAMPKRVFMGSEQGELASTQDATRWNRRVMGRQNGYITPFLITPLLERFMAIGVLPQVEDYITQWPDLNSPDDSSRAATALSMAQAIAAYMNGQGEQLVPPLQFLTIFMGLTTEEAQACIEAAQEYIEAAQEAAATAADEAVAQQQQAAQQAAQQDKSSTQEATV